MNKTALHLFPSNKMHGSYAETNKSANEKTNDCHDLCTLHCITPVDFRDHTKLYIVLPKQMLSEQLCLSINFFTLSQPKKKSHNSIKI